MLTGADHTEAVSSSPPHRAHFVGRSKSALEVMSRLLLFVIILIERCLRNYSISCADLIDLYQHDDDEIFVVENLGQSY
jgi:hypothetical protein